MSLCCSISTEMPKRAVVDSDGHLLDERSLRSRESIGLTLEDGVVAVATRPSFLSPSVGLPTRNLRALCGILRSEMDRIFIELHCNRSELTKIRAKIAIERGRISQAETIVRRFGKNGA